MPQGTGDRLSSPLGQKRQRGLESPCPLTHPLQSAVKLKKPQLPVICPWPAQSRIPRRGQKNTLNFFLILVFFTYPLSPVPWSLEEEAGRCFWRCYYKNNRVFFGGGVVWLFSWGKNLGLWCPFVVTFFVNYTHGISAPSTTANFPGLGWQKGGFAEDCLLLWIYQWCDRH